MDKDKLEQLIRDVIAEEFQKHHQSCPMDKRVDKSGVLGVTGKTVHCERFDSGNDQDEVYLKDIVTLEESPNLGAGYMEVINGNPFAWTLSYDEVDVILEGTLEIITPTGKIRGKAGDTLFIPKNSSIQFTCPEGEKVRFVYVTYPADWQ